jgi:hypothetical protein
MKSTFKKPPNSPDGDVLEWREQVQRYVSDSWGQYLAVATDQNSPVPDDLADVSLDDGESEIEGKLRALIAEREHIMVCIGHRVVKTRFEIKDYLFWRETKDGPVLEQFFRHYEIYPVQSKAVQNYIVAIGSRPKRLDRFSFRVFIGLKAEVYVETVKPCYSTGALKGRPKPAVTHYSKVSEIFCPLGYVDAQTIKDLRGDAL